MINVKNFGAVGNGHTDDTAAIQAALDTGEVVYIPEGKYMITDSLIMKNIKTETIAVARGQRIFGDGKERSIISTEWLPEYKSAVVVGCTHSQLDNFSIEYPYVKDGESSDGIKRRGIGLKFDGSNEYGNGVGRYVTVKDMFFLGLHTAIDMGRSTWCNLVQSIQTKYCDTAISINESANYINLIDCDIETARFGFDIRVSNDYNEDSSFFLINIDSCRAELIQENAIRIQGSGIVNVTNCYFERNLSTDILTLKSGNGKQYLHKLNVKNSFFVAWSNDGYTERCISLQGVKHASIEDNYFWSYSDYVISGLKQPEAEGHVSMANIEGNTYRYCNKRYDYPQYATISDGTDRSIGQREKHYDSIDIIVPNGKEKQLLFKGQDESMKSYMFYHAGGNTFGCYDAQGTRAIWRTKLGTTDLTFNKNLIPESALNIGSSSNKWSKIYATTGVIQTSDVNQKEDIKPIDVHNVLNSSKDEDIDKLTSADFTEFVKNANFVTYKWKDKEVAPKGLETQVGFIAQDISKDKVGSLISTKKEYSMTNLVMSMGVALQEALKEIEELKNK